MKPNSVREATVEFLIKLFAFLFSQFVSN